MGLQRMGPPTELMVELSKEFSVGNFIETGTFLGSTALWAATQFVNVHTIENSKSLYNNIVEKHKDMKNVIFHFGKSQDILNQIVPTFTRPTMYWLDAHWSGGDTFGEAEQCPIIDEIATINNLSKTDNFIFIDDARFFLSPPQSPQKFEQWPGIAQIINTLQKIELSTYIVITEDVIIAVPQRAKLIVAKYCQQVNERIWVDYCKKNKPTFFKKFCFKLNKMLNYRKTN